MSISSKYRKDLCLSICQSHPNERGNTQTRIYSESETPEYGYGHIEKHGLNWALEKNILQKQRQSQSVTLNTLAGHKTRGQTSETTRLADLKLYE